jgi:hypothetical protein
MSYFLFLHDEAANLVLNYFNKVGSWRRLSIRWKGKMDDVFCIILSRE